VLIHFSVDLAIIYRGGSPDFPGDENTYCFISLQKKASCSQKGGRRLCRY